MEVERNQPSQEEEAHRAAKHNQTGQRGPERKNNPQEMPPAWLLAPMLNGEPLLATASIRDFQGGTARYVADAVEQALLVPGDMAELRSMRRHEVFLNMKRYLAMVYVSLNPFFSGFLLYSISHFFFLY